MKVSFCSPKRNNKGSLSKLLQPWEFLFISFFLWLQLISIIQSETAWKKVEAKHIDHRLLKEEEVELAFLVTQCAHVSFATTTFFSLMMSQMSELFFLLSLWGNEMFLGHKIILRSTLLLKIIRKLTKRKRKYSQGLSFVLYFCIPVNHFPSFTCACTFASCEYKG